MLKVEGAKYVNVNLYTIVGSDIHIYGRFPQSNIF